MKFLLLIFMATGLMVSCGQNLDSSTTKKYEFTTKCRDAFAWGNTEQEVVYFKNTKVRWDYKSYSWGLDSVRQCNGVLNICKKDHPKNAAGCQILFVNIYKN